MFKVAETPDAVLAVEDPYNIGPDTEAVLVSIPGRHARRVPLFAALARARWSVVGSPDAAKPYVVPSDWPVLGPND